MAKKRRLSKRSGSAYSPLAPGFETQGQFDRAVRLRAGEQYRPQLQEIRRETGAEQRATGQRIQDIGAATKQYGDELEQSYARMNDALNRLVATENAASVAGQQTLQGALNAGQERQMAMSQTVGGPNQQALPQGPSPLPAAHGLAEAGRGALGTSVAGMIAEAAQRRALAGQSRVRATEAEQRRSRGVITDLGRQRRDILARRPELMEAARGELSGEEQDKANLRFQQKVARSELGLKGREQSLEEQKFEHQKYVDSVTLNQQQQQIDNEVDSAITEDDAANAEARSKAFAAGTSYITGLMNPSKQEEGKRKLRKSYTQRVNSPGLPAQAYNHLTKILGLDDHDATVILNSVNQPNFQKWVKRHRGRKHAPGVKGSPVAGPPTPASKL